MMLMLGVVLGALVTFIAFVIVMAPKHWEWYHENVQLKKDLKVALEQAAHYKNLVKPSEWGPVDQHEARIIKKERPYDGVTLEPGQAIDFVFDDIKQTP